MSTRPGPRPGPLYAIADASLLGAAYLPAAVAKIAACGIEWIQLRAKALSGRALLAACEGCLGALAGSAARLWIDDRADVAALLASRAGVAGVAEMGAVAGVHLGQHDLPPAAVRRVVGSGVWIGLSTHDERQLLAADADPDVDLIAVGPIFPSTGKERPDPVVGLPFLRWARAHTPKPLVAIGGIGPQNLAQVLAAGADAAAVLGALCRGDLDANCRRLVAAAAAAAAAGEAGRLREPREAPARR